MRSVLNSRQDADLNGEDGVTEDVTVAKRAILDAFGRLDCDLDRIFFESSGTQSFASDDVRAAFRERWLGRYLRHYPEWVYLAVTSQGAAVGYLLGCLDDPAKHTLFDDIGYFKSLSPLTETYPAHLHVNIDAAYRGRGLGQRLVAAFAADAAKAGSPGVHVVTGEGMRNTRFYANVGFAPAGVFPWNGRPLVFLGRRLTA